MKRYRVVFKYLAADTVEVEAHSKYEAIEKAESKWAESIDVATGQQTYQEEVIRHYQPIAKQIERP